MFQYKLMQVNNASISFDVKPVQCGAVTLNVAMVGAGSPVIFLHGFPEYWRAFAPLMTNLSTHFLCIAPDQRGFGGSDRPKDPSAYTIDQLADDISNLIDAFGFKQVDIVAHNWGGLVAWHFGSRHRARVRKMVIFNAPHPVCFQRALDTDPDQRAASAYAAKFASPNSHAVFALKSASEHWDAFFGRDFAENWLNDNDIALQIAEWERDGAWETMLNWYRAAAFDYSGQFSGHRDVPPAILAQSILVWGDADALFAPSSLKGLAELAPNCEIKRIAGGGHCAFREDLPSATQLIKDFLSESR